MSKKIYILVVEDELEVMEALIQDLEKFEVLFPVEAANNTIEAEEVINSILEKGDKVGLILCDHILPGKNGIDLLIELNENGQTSAMKKVLVTGQARHEDTIIAVNKADLDHYIEKPWKQEELEKVVTDELTDFVIENESNLLPFMQVLDMEKISHHLRKNKMTDN